MFSSKPNYTQLKTNLKLCINRLKLLQKKKTEMAMKSRKEIAELISAGKVERAKIRVEHIIREDYLVEAMELVELFADLLLARFGLLQATSQVDSGLVEAIASLIWVAPRMFSDVQELKQVAKQLSLKYGEPFAQICRENKDRDVSERLVHKMSVEAPPKLTVEKYLIEIAKYYNVDYDPDPQVMRHDAEAELIDIGIPNVPFIPGGGMGGGGFDVKASEARAPGFPAAPGASAPRASVPFEYPSQPTFPADTEKPPPYSPSEVRYNNFDDDKKPTLPDLPDIPSDSPLRGNSPTPPKKKEDDNIDFDDLARRFEELKKKK